jgi:adenylosuccinate synthase
LCYKLDEVTAYITEKLYALANVDSLFVFESVFKNYVENDEFALNDEGFIENKINSFLDTEYFPRLKVIVDKIRGKLINSDIYIQDLYQQQKNIILEGAQGWGLDVWGRSYPNVTSSSPNIGGVLTATGLNHKQIDEVIGIVKLYKSKVGEGLHNTELNFENNIMFDNIDEVRQILGEFGATTGRPRRLGWLNLDEVSAACKTNGVDRIVITRIDSIGEIMTPNNSIRVYSDNQYLGYSAWLTQDLCADEEAFLTQPDLLFFVEDVKKITGVKNISLSYGPKRSQLKW